MGSSDVYLVVDIGTSSIRTTLYSIEEGFIDQMKQENHISDRVDINRIWIELKEMMSQLVRRNPAYNVRCICISSFLGWVAVDNQGQPVTQAWTWMDKQVNMFEQYKEHISSAQFQVTGRRLTSEIAALKWIALKTEHPEIYKRVETLTTMKDFFNFKLTGVHLMDMTHAGYTGLFSVYDMSWDNKLLESFGIDVRLLPNLGEGTDIVGEVMPSISTEMRLSKDTRVVLGGPDGSMAVVGGGGIRKGSSINVTGTTDVLFSVHEGSSKEQSFTEPDYSLIHNRHLLPNLWLSGGPMGMTGGTVNWFLTQWTDRHEQADGEVNLYQRFETLAEKVNPGAQGIIFIPTLSGERTPTWYSNMKGTLIGISPEHHKGHLYRALLEGIGFTLKSVIKKLYFINLDVDALICLGGGAQSRLGLQIRADIIGRPVHIPVELEASTLGAAVLCAFAINGFDDIERVATNMNPITQTLYPDQAHHMSYKKYYQAYQKAIETMHQFYTD